MQQPNQTQTETAIVSPEFEPIVGQYIAQKELRFMVLGHPEIASTGDLPTITPDRRAMILYTSGTTNLPKGVVTTRASVDGRHENVSVDGFGIGGTARFGDGEMGNHQRQRASPRRAKF
ncbi:MAG: hypothetical protein LH609_07680 [Rudanella sp.]|nr:hypothetical protein [Rudanella sp.]